MATKKVLVTGGGGGFIGGHLVAELLRQGKEVRSVDCKTVEEWHQGATPRRPKRRAPKAMQRLGLEWLYRLAAEPRRLGGRYLRTNSEFPALLGWELLQHRSGT